MIVKEISNSLLTSSKRLDASYFLNKNALLSKVIEDNYKKCSSLGNIAVVFNPPIFKRQFCENSSRSIMYCQSSDVANGFDGSNAFINKIQAEKVGAVVKENQILVTGFGTVGNIRMVNVVSSGIAYANNVCRIEVNAPHCTNLVYAFLASKYGRAQLNKNASGTVVRYIEAPGIAKTLIPKFGVQLENKIHELISKSAELRVLAANMIKQSEEEFIKVTGLKKLTKMDFESFGYHSHTRDLSFFTISSQNLTSVTINAFNHSQRIRKIIEYVKGKITSIPLIESLSSDKFFSTGSFPRVEIDSPQSVKLINQSDIFNQRIDGKKIARNKVKLDNLVSYGEILIAGVGTLGENETFCKVVFASEELEGQLVSGEFIRMKSSKSIPAGYLFTWLSSEYGFRLIRSTQTGTKLCRPIQALLAEIPVPILGKKEMENIHQLVCEAHTMRYEALQKENEAISLIEKEIESWQK
jgi:type I restriction enzyme S subunit